MQYKCVPAPGHLTIDNNGNFDDAVRSYANLINKEATANWEFHSLETITVTQNPGCLSGLLYNIPLIGNLFGKPPITKYCNMFIFSNKHIENKINEQYEEQKINDNIMFINKSINLLKEPKIGSDVIINIKQGENIKLLEKGSKIIPNIEDYWAKVEYKDEIIGWCYTSNLNKK